MALINKLTAIADAIRAKTGGTSQLSLDEMATAIAGIETGGGATEPYVEETYINNADLRTAKLVGYTFVRDNMFKYCKNLGSVYLPNSVTWIGASSFYECSNFTAITFPSNLDTIKRYAFYNNYLKNLTFPSSLTTLDDGAFCNCTHLISVTFEGTPTTIYNTVFKSCTNLATINVPWAEGAVANAPWGATNATINYNYTGGSDAE